ncbi:MAG: thiamine diphosphokinase [Bacillota bacterium]|nr:thiamine diphosphokinase [Bacillota bacterium]HHT91089.1 thiamine diphosphokinase [Bacillota bacterium]
MNRSISRPALIVASGEDVPKEPPALNDGNTLVICANGGAKLARLWNLTPGLILGDQDSLDASSKEYWLAKGIPLQSVSAVKDETDLDLAVQYALNQGADSLTLVGGWGSRIDHSLGNVELLYRLALLGIPNQLLTRDHRLSAVCRGYKTQVRQGSIVSLLPLSPEVSGLTTSGLLYALEKVTIRKGSTLTISNVATATDISVEMANGVLLIIMEQ